MSYQESHILIKRGEYVIYSLKHSVSGRNVTLWGPDANGRFCRLGAYLSTDDASRALMALTERES